MQLRQAQQEWESTLAQSIDALEGLHRNLVTAILDTLEAKTPFAETIRSLRPNYENTTAQIFDWLRSCNRTSGEWVRSFLDRAGP